LPPLDVAGVEDVAVVVVLVEFLSNMEELLL
jgi:hypothetical protein